MSLKLFYRQTENDLEMDQLIEKYNLLTVKSDVYLRSIEALIHFLKSFALDVREIHSGQFKDTVDALLERFSSMERPKQIELHFEHQKASILAFIERQHLYISDREKELRDIIELLTKAMANLDIENREFYQRVHDQGEKMDQITLLDDIKKIKSALAHEVAQMREIVNIKKDQDRRQVQHLASQVECLREELEKSKAKSMTDGLTGVYNRQAFNDTIVEVIERSRVMHSTFSLLMLDLDDFKKINDTYGHLVGDQVLVALCQKCRNAIRGDDFMARYGGEEFAIILTGASLRNALKKARSICTAVSTSRYATCSDENDDYLCMTVSIGVTEYRKDDTADSVISRADKALYKAKKSGKNRAVAKKL